MLEEGKALASAYVLRGINPLPLYALAPRESTVRHLYPYQENRLDVALLSVGGGVDDIDGQILETAQLRWSAPEAFASTAWPAQATKG